MKHTTQISSLVNQNMLDYYATNKAARDEWSRKHLRSVLIWTAGLIIGLALALAVGN